jgi:hypothetical protein
MNPRSAAEVALGVAGIWLMVSRVPTCGDEFLGGAGVFSSSPA